MISSCARFAIAALLAGAGTPAFAVPVNANFSATVDQSGGHSYDADFGIDPTGHLSFDAGVGQSTSSRDNADLRGTLFNAGASFHGERAGAALSYDRFDDSSNYQSGTLGARLWFAAGDFEFSLLGRQRNSSVAFTLRLPNRTVRRDVDFSAVGTGLQLAFNRGNFSAYALGLTYDYDDGFDAFIALAESPQLARRPLIEALVGSFVTQAQGAIDQQFGAGVEQTFGRHSVGLDVSSVRDAIDATTSTSVALNWRYAQSAHLDWTLSGGIVDSDRYGDLGFVGLSVGIGN